MKILESLAVWRFFQRKFSVSLRTVMYAIIATTFISLTGWILRFDQTASPYSAKVFQYLSILSKTNLFNETIKNSNSSQTNFSWTLDSFTKSNSSSICPVISPLLKGSNLNDINSLKVKIPSWEEIELQHPELEPGGRHHPKCISRHKVAIIIPYRNRDEHLRAFTAYMHSFLQKQQLDYGIYVVEQMGNNSFNRAMLMNIGYREATLQHSYGCFIFHDVDLLPEIDQNLYVCSKTNPRHFSASINTHGYKLPYKTIFGGVGGMSLEQLQKTNGFSNMFWGWGGEDDDMYNRLHHNKYQIMRYPQNIARYTMMTHKKETPSPQRFKFLYGGMKRYKTDGLNSLVYERVDLKLKKLYTLVQVNIKKADVMKNEMAEAITKSNTFRKRMKERKDLLTIEEDIKQKVEKLKTMN